MPKYKKLFIFLPSEYILTVHDLVPLVPVGAFGAVLHSCERGETVVKVNPHCADTHAHSLINI